MPATRLQNGFHRVGLVLSGVLAVPTFVLAPYAILTGAPSSDVTIMSGIALAAAVLLYAVCRAFAWIAEGFFFAQPVRRETMLAADRDWRRWLVIVLEAALLLIVLACIGYFGLTAFDDGRTSNEQMFAGWSAAILTLVSFYPLARRRMERSGSPALRDYAYIIDLLLLGAAAVTVIGTMMGARKYGLSTDLVLLLVVLFVMFTWPEARHRILNGAWRPT